MVFLTSWDDGHPLDMRVADMLEKHGLKGTFYVPIRNREGRPVMSVEALRELDKCFEIGGHTLDHTYLTTISDTVAEYQIDNGKSRLQEILGHDVVGFCYPGGKYNRRIRNAVIRSGFKYARTIENLRLDCHGDCYAVPTTLQFFPHSRQVLCKNYLSHGHYWNRSVAFISALSTRDWSRRLMRLAEQVSIGDSVIHIWGHSWEIEEHGLWPHLDMFFASVAALRPCTRTVKDWICQQQQRQMGR